MQNKSGFVGCVTFLVAFIVTSFVAGVLLLILASRVDAWFAILAEALIAPRPFATFR